MEQHKWKGPLYRFLRTLLTTFWLLFIRMFLVRHRCSRKKSDRACAHKWLRVRMLRSCHTTRSIAGTLGLHVRLE